MTDDIEARRGALTAQLWAQGHRIGEPTYEGQRQRSERIAEIQAELASLPEKPPEVIGEKAGIVAIHNVLGDRLVRPPPIEPDYEDEADPYLRFMRECKQEWR
jgi:hypothetical protein